MKKFKDINNDDDLTKERVISFVAGMFSLLIMNLLLYGVTHVHITFN